MRAAQLFVLLAILGSAAAVGAAGGDKQAKKAAKKLLAEGDRLFGKKDFDGALAKYQKAYEAYPDAKIFYAMGVAESELGRDLDALYHFEMLLAEAKGLPGALKKDAETRVTSLQGKISEVTFDVRPAGAVISVDGVEIGEAPLATPMRLMPGAHAYVVTLDKYKTVEKTLDLKPGDRVEESVELKKPKPRKPKPKLKPEPVAKPREKKAPSKGVLIAGVVLTGALFTTSLITGGLAADKHSTFADGTLPDDVRRDAQDAGRTLATTTDVLLVSTVVIGGCTAFYYFKVYKPAKRRAGRREAPAREQVKEVNEEGEEARLPRTIVAPYLAPGGAGIAITGRF